ncbi:hypothetical protein ACNI65_19535 [Roseateles sp. So40a]|uniref:hypothetical protein n=1 Tax=Roseateles sp. So40a TaxID=3400226 RepID=UPI003A84892B
MLNLLLLLLAKLVIYAAVCWTAPKHLHIKPKDVMTFALAWGSSRLALGVLATAPLAFLVTLLASLGLPMPIAFVLVLLPTRSLLWWIVARAICRRHQPASVPQLKHWVFLGVCASFAVDGLVWLSDADFKFFC